MKTTKECKKCHLIKPLHGFHRTNQNKDGRHSWCKPCVLEYNKKYQNRPKLTEEERLATYPRNPRKVPTKLVKEALKMRKQGFTFRVIEADLGISAGYLRNYTTGKVKIKGYDAK